MIGRVIGHFIFLGLHGVAVCAGCWGLIITVPLHLIYCNGSVK